MMPTPSRGIRDRRVCYAALTVAELRSLIYSRPGSRDDRAVYDRRYKARRELARRQERGETRA